MKEKRVIEFMLLLLLLLFRFRSTMRVFQLGEKKQSTRRKPKVKGEDANAYRVEKGIKPPIQEVLIITSPCHP